MELSVNQTIALNIKKSIQKEKGPHDCVARPSVARRQKDQCYLPEHELPVERTPILASDDVGSSQSPEGAVTNFVIVIIFG